MNFKNNMINNYVKEGNIYNQQLNRMNLYKKCLHFQQRKQLKMIVN